MPARSTYQREVADRICALVADGKTLKGIARMPGMPPSSTIHEWLARHSEFKAGYEAACELRAEARADEVDTIVEKALKGEIEPAAARVAIDAIKWQCAIEKPGKYSEKVRHEVIGHIVHEARSLSDEQLAKIAAQAIEAEVIDASIGASGST